MFPSKCWLQISRESQAVNWVAAWGPPLPAFLLPVECDSEGEGMAVFIGSKSEEDPLSPSGFISALSFLP